MIKILILSLHYPPDNIIAARRSEAYAQHFHKFDIFPIIVTDRYEKVYEGQGKLIGYKYHNRYEKPITEQYKTHYVVRLPRYITPLQWFQKSIERIPLLSPLFTLLMNCLGHFDMHLLSHHANYKSFLSKHLKNNSYDMILAIDSPHFHVRLAYLLHKEFRIPYIVDFRDLYDNNILNQDYRPTLKRRIINNLKKKAFTKWLKNTKLITASSQLWADYYAGLVNCKGFEITNGFEATDYEAIEQEKTKFFQIASTGRLYFNQDWSVFASGVRKFISEQNPDNFRVVFAGVRKDADNIIKTIKSFIPEQYLMINGWLVKEEVYRIQCSSSILIVASWQGTVGVYSGKIFEYLGARRPILFAPGDNDGVVDRLLKRTRAGISANTPQEVCTFITEKYKEWKQTGRVSYNGTDEEILKYTRENQVKKMAELIHNFLPAKSNR